MGSAVASTATREELIEQIQLLHEAVAEKEVALKRISLELGRNTMARMTLRVSEELAPLWDRMKQDLRASSGDMAASIIGTFSGHL